MKNLFKISIALLVTAALAACGGSKPMPDETPEMTEEMPEEKTEMGGTVEVKTPDGKAKKTLKKFEGDRMEAMEEDDD